MWLSDMTGAQVAHNGNLRATYRNKWHSGLRLLKIGSGPTWRPNEVSKQG